MVCTIDRTKKLKARFFETSSGRKPVREWLLDLKAEDRRIVGYDVETVEFGWPVGMPTCRPLGNALWEVRSDLTDGTIGRGVFCILKGDMVLLHGFIKNTQRTPLQDIELAKKRKNEIEFQKRRIIGIPCPKSISKVERTHAASVQKAEIDSDPPWREQHQWANTATSRL